MTKNDIPNPKLNDPNDNQPFYIRILQFFLVSLTLIKAKKVCDCAKSSRLPLNFLMNSGWGYLSLPSLEISAKSQQGIFCYEPKQDFSDNSDLQWQPKKCVLRKI